MTQPYQLDRTGDHRERAPKTSTKSRISDLGGRKFSVSIVFIYFYSLCTSSIDFLTVRIMSN